MGCFFFFFVDWSLGVVAVLENNDYITSWESLWVTKVTPTRTVQQTTSEVNACKTASRRHVSHFICRFCATRRKWTITITWNWNINIARRTNSGLMNHPVKCITHYTIAVQVHKHFCWCYWKGMLCLGLKYERYNNHMLFQFTIKSWSSTSVFTWTVVVGFEREKAYISFKFVFKIVLIIEYN